MTAILCALELHYDQRAVRGQCEEIYPEPTVFPLGELLRDDEQIVTKNLRMITQDPLEIATLSQLLALEGRFRNGLEPIRIKAIRWISASKTFSADPGDSEAAARKCARYSKGVRCSEARALSRRRRWNSPCWEDAIGIAVPM